MSDFSYEVLGEKDGRVSVRFRYKGQRILEETKFPLTTRAEFETRVGRHLYVNVVRLEQREVRKGRLYRVGGV